MFVRNNNGPIFLFLLLCGLTGCVSSSAPSGWLPPVESVPTDVYGGWLKVEKREFKGYSMALGEFIGLRDSAVFLLTEKGYLKMIPMKDVRNATLFIHENNGGKAALTTFLGTVSTISNGFYLLITAPIWIISGTILTVQASNKGNYYQAEPDFAWWDSFKLYARFPQGIPENFGQTPLKPKPHE